MEMYMVSEVEDGYKKFNPFQGYVVKMPINLYEPKIQEFAENVYYHGYWINKDWFEAYKKEFLEEFTFPILTDEKNKAYEREILSTPSVCLHVRRGDYVILGESIEAEKYK